MSQPQSRLAAARPALRATLGLRFTRIPGGEQAVAGLSSPGPARDGMGRAARAGALAATGRLTNAQAERAYREPLHVIHGQGVRGSCGGPAR